MKVFLLLFFSVFNLSLIQAEEIYIQKVFSGQALITDVIYDLHKDAHGNLLVGTDKGIFSFNGINFSKITLKSFKSLGITSIVTDNFSRVWCRNFSNQLFYLDNDTLHPFEALDAYLNKENIIDVKQNGNLLYVATFSQILSINTTTFSIEKIVQDEAIISFSIYNQNPIYITANGLLHIIERKSFTNIIPLPSRNCRSIVWKNKLMVVNSQSKLNVLYEVKKNTLVPLMNLNFSSKLNHINADDNFMAICTASGVVFTDYKLKQQTIASKFNCTDFLIDREGNYWLSTLSEGLRMIPNLEVKILLEKPENDNFISLEIVKDRVFLGTTKGNLIVYQNQSIKEIKTLKANYEIEFIKFDSTNNQLFHSYGIYNLNNHKNVDFYYGKSVDLNHKKDVFFAIHSFLGVRYRSYQQTFSKIHQQQINDFFVLRNGRCRSVVSLNDSTLVAAFIDGLFLFNPHSIVEIKDTDGQSIYASQIAKLNNETFFVASLDKGVLRIENQHIKAQFSTQNILSNNHISKIKLTKNLLTVIHESGVEVVDIEMNNQIFSSVEAGLQNIFFNDALIFEDKIYTITNAGLLAIPIHRKPQINVSKVEIIKINGKKLNKDFYSLGYDESNVTIGIEPISFKKNQFTKLYYRLKPIENEYKTTGVFQNELVYSHLKPGVYEFQITSNLQSAPEILRFEINTPYHQHYLFYLLIAICLLTLLFFIVTLYNKRKLRKQLLKEKLIQSRLTALRAQMNPHFLFNVLNSLQGLIYAKKINEAGYYISLFSDFLRDTLKISEKQTISLKEEIESLQSYLQLEKLRFGDDFTFSIQLQPGISESFKIPGMLLQPFVENAVKHGLLNKNGDKNLIIKFSSNQPDMLTVTIEDNGIGREKSKQLNEKRISKHQSFAVNAIANRIQLLNESRSFKIAFTIDDLKQNDKPIGTKVTLQIIKIDK